MGQQIGAKEEWRNVRPADESQTTLVPPRLQRRVHASPPVLLVICADSHVCNSQLHCHVMSITSPSLASSRQLLLLL